MDKLKEECGVVAIYTEGKTDMGYLLYSSLISLQHRGQQSAGIAAVNDGVLYNKKGLGLVQEVFIDNEMQMEGNMGIAHVRYSPDLDRDNMNIQPFSFIFRGTNIAYGHNGNIVNYKSLRSKLEKEGIIFRRSSDSEIVSHLIAKNYNGCYIDSVKKTMQTIKGSYAFTMIIDNKLVGIRDPFGIRPLILGKFNDGYILASESVALDAIGAEIVRDVEPGEMIVIDENGVKSIKFSDNTKLAHSAFEYVYFARPDSVIDGVSVYKARLRAGEILARSYPVDADLVIPVPDSGRSAAIGYAQYSGIEYGEGLIKNKYVGRTFIQPTQQLREIALKMKLNVLREIVEGKKIVLVDDSIVRGTTIRKIVDMLKKGGAKEVHLRISSPMVKFPSYYGIDTPDPNDLIANHYSVKEICEHVNADTLEFLSVDELVESIGFKRDELCLDVFTGEYPVEIEDLNFEEK